MSGIEDIYNFEIKKESDKGYRRFLIKMIHLFSEKFW
jgi:hypothetical protein